jgi:hypothetical protein
VEIILQQIGSIMTRTLAKPAALITAVFIICITALFVFGQDASAQVTQSVTADDVFKYFGYIAVGVSALAVATAAVFTTLRKSALTEWKELAESRKGKIVEQALEIVKKDGTIARLESENEELEKKNLRLQDNRKP